MLLFSRLLSLSGPTAAGLLFFASYTSALEGWKFNEGKTEILGNSFGVPGVEVTYDYIVVGAGTAGGAVAARLALAGFSVGLIEGGSFYELDNGNRTTIPGYDQTTHPNDAGASLVDYDFVTGPEPGLNGRSLHYTQGRTFGGSSALNLMGYQRGTVGSFEKWASIVGNDLWKWDNVFYFYKKSANFTPPNYDKIDPRFNISYDPSAFDNSLGGPLQISYGNNQQDYSPGVAHGFEAMGLSLIPGLNSGYLLGYGPMSATVNPKAATRETSQTSFVQTAIDETDIKLYQTTTVKKILFDDDKKAIGVEVEGHGGIPVVYNLYASKEIVVSAGAFRSPQLLMASGVGPKAILDQFSIPVVADLPGVGQGIQDQVWLGFSYGVNVTTKTQIVLNNPDYTKPAIDLYLHNQSGPLSGIGAGEQVGWEKLPKENRARLTNETLAWLSTFPDDWPDVEYQDIAFSSVPDDIRPDGQYMTFGAALLTPKSHGNVTLRSNDTNDYPVIMMNYLLDPVDQGVAIEAFKRLRQWARGSGILVDEFNPPEDVETDEQIFEWIKAEATFIYHASCGCAMGRDDNPAAVLDAQARVRGVTGLRVVDTSSFPVLPPGHPLATVYMVAEKIANAIIKGELE
ncbi:GMC oxidoreductase [Aplosporella prunicola CBS 121167]|uniref:GMC oxidoreductase n=1 Tax=Aplosporella prunicola CBS 121167 TaxID=1176127 RepID=A0A6A6B3G4_9PEZI|nr:GMC oxidoreductase [Aplosporella prunicola CBS 121167]KAF2137754.1 GMC oxidoreductase [Aplosporella prunicola CBS 121167]